MINELMSYNSTATGPPLSRLQTNQIQDTSLCLQVTEWTLSQYINGGLVVNKPHELFL